MKYTRNISYTRSFVVHPFISYLLRPNRRNPTNNILLTHPSPDARAIHCIGIHIYIVKIGIYVQVYQPICR